MRDAHRSLSWRWLPLLLVAVAPATASAQTDPQRTWAVVPSLGLGVVRRNGQWGSAGLEAALDLEYARNGWRWGAYGSIRGVGVGCSEGCFEDEGATVAMGGSRSVGRVWIGGGAGVMKRFGEWRLAPYGRISVDAAPVRLDLRIELPREGGVSVYAPFLVGIPVSL
jgi:hypothetical protein